MLEEIQAGVTHGLEDIEQRVSHTTSSICLFGSREQLAGDYLTGAVAANMGIYGQVAEEAIYGGSRSDASGDELLGDQRYELRFNKATLPDAKFFWSITLYEPPSRLLADNPIDRYSIGDRTPGITYAENGSLTIVPQSTAPTDPVERANWLPNPAPGPVHRHLPHLRARTRGPSRQLVTPTDPKCRIARQHPSNQLGAPNGFLASRGSSPRTWHETATPTSRLTSSRLMSVSGLEPAASRV